MSKRRAINKLRGAPHYQREAFNAGLIAAGYQIMSSVDNVGPGDALLLWNRKPIWGELADEFDARGGIVFVAESAYLPASMIGSGWFALAEGWHCGLGRWPKGSNERWDALGVELKPWRTGGTETLILDQNAGGLPGVASPKHWAETIQAQIGGRIRWHPWKVSVGRAVADQPALIEDDLQNVAQVVTWSSSAALMALVMGIPVFYALKHWIGAQAARPIAEFGQEPKRDDEARLAMFRRLAYAMWRVQEIRNGTAFKALMGMKK
jgi:hypothetical protein